MISIAIGAILVTFIFMFPKHIVGVFNQEPVTMGLLAEDVLKGVKMMVDDIFTENGVVAPEQLPIDARRYYFEEIAKLGVTVDVTIS